MSGDAATLSSGVAWTRGGQCTGPTLARRPFFPGPRPPKVAPVPVAATRSPPSILLSLHVLGLVFASFFSLFLPYPLAHCTPSNAFGSYTRCAFNNSSYPLLTPNPHPLAITRTSPVSAALIIPRSVRANTHPSIHPSPDQDHHHREHAAAAITATTRPVTLAQTRPPARVKRCTNQPLSQTTHLQSFPAVPKLTLRPVIHDP
jgi:hypothetical protein